MHEQGYRKDHMNEQGYRKDHMNEQGYRKDHMNEQGYNEQGIKHQVAYFFFSFLAFLGRSFFVVVFIQGLLLLTKPETETWRLFAFFFCVCVCFFLKTTTNVVTQLKKNKIHTHRTNRKQYHHLCQ